jgi:hypothetical protein
VEEVVASLDRGDETQLIAFAQKHGQSLEWILTGDLVMMLRKFAAWNLSRTAAAPAVVGTSTTEYGQP